MDDFCNYEIYLTCIRLPEEIRQNYNRNAEHEMLVRQGLEAFLGGEGQQNFEKAARCFLTAAMHQDGRACFLYGICCQKGYGTGKDDVQAVSWFEAAFKAGYGPAAAAVGDCYACGRGVAANDTAAAQWYLKGAEAGDAQAQINYGRCLERGCGVDKNPEEAWLWYARAAALGRSDALSEQEDLLDLTPPPVHDSLMEEPLKFVTWTDPYFGKLIGRALNCPPDNIRLEYLNAIEGMKIRGNAIALNKDSGFVYESEAGCITGLRDLRCFPNLRWLEIENHRLKSLDGLEKLTRLKQLRLQRAEVRDISVLRALKSLEILDLAFNNIEDITPLKKLLRLKQLDLSHNKIVDIYPLSTLCKLEFLSLKYNKITNIDVLLNLNGLKQLLMGETDIGNRGIDIVSQLPNLIRLDLSGCSVTNISGLQRLHNLKRLELKNNRIANVDILLNLDQLTAVDLRGNIPLSSISLMKLGAKKGMKVIK